METQNHQAGPPSNENFVVLDVLENLKQITEFPIHASKQKYFN